MYSQVTELLAPLQRCYDLEGLTLPPVRFLPPDAVPEPYQQLLVHRSDMTGTLERFYRESVELRVLEQEPSPDVLLRMVVLLLRGTERPVEFGAIHINLERFSPEVAGLIREGHVPLGGILQQYSVYHENKPQGYFRIQADSFIRQALRVRATKWLFGRQNHHVNAHGELLADIVEVLPPEDWDFAI